MSQSGSSRSGWQVPINAPGPSGGQMLKSFGRIRRDPLQFLAAIWREYGDVVQFPIPRPAVYLLTDPDGVRDVLVASARDYNKRTLQYDNLATVTGSGLLTADDPPWRARRRVIQPAFHHERLASVAEHAVAAVEPYLARWQRLGDGAVVDVDEAMMELSLQVVASALFGSQWDAQAKELTQATLVALDQVVARARNPLAPPLNWPTPGSTRLRRSIRTLDAAVAEVLTARRTAGAADGANEDDDRGDLVDMLLAARSDPAAQLGGSGVRDELVTFLVAGHETVASTMTWVWQLIACNPTAAAALHAEVDSVLAGRLPTFADVPHLRWTRAIVDETLRLYPPAWVITRKSTAGHVATGVAMPTGSLVIMSPYLVHRHPDAWDRPEEFDPSRFLDGSTRRDAYLPFGLGPRLCIGRDMALLEATLVVAAIASRFRFESVGSDAVEALASVTLRPQYGLPMRVYGRNSSAIE
ncbi:MAG: cytochrome P450 [Candidatus Nanopelagicales bacterium]